MTTRHLLIHGRVQGVGYRYALETMANSMRLQGWVHNRIDGTVEAVVQGPEESVLALIAWAKHGPPTAKVSKVDVQAHPLIEQSDFLRRPTA